MAHNFEQALRLMEAALTDCPDDLWQTDLWPDEAPTGPAPHGGLHGSAPGSIPQVIEEALRFDSPTRALWRRSKSDTTIGGVAITTGDKLYCVTSSAAGSPTNANRRGLQTCPFA